MPCCSQSCPTLCDPMYYNPPYSPVQAFPCKKTGVGCHFLLQGIFLTQVSNPHLLHLMLWQAGSLPLSHWGSPQETITLYLSIYLSLSRGLPYNSDGKEFACNAGDPGLKNHQFSSVQSPHNPSQISRTSALLKCICLSFILFSLTFPPPSLCLSLLTHFLY